MKELRFTARFKKDVNLCKKQGKDIEKLKKILNFLIKGEEIPAKYKDHPLKGNWSGYRDLHIEPDWVLIYKNVNNQVVLLVATGSHAYLLK